MSELVTIADEVPFPPRYWWLKRIVVAYAVLFVALLTLRLWWGHVAHHRLETEIAKYKAAGEPIEPFACPSHCGRVEVIPLKCERFSIALAA